MHRTGTGPFTARPYGGAGSSQPRQEGSGSGRWAPRPTAYASPANGAAAYGSPASGSPAAGQDTPDPGYPPRPPATGSGLDAPATPAPGWPLRSQLELGPLPGAVPCARLHARLVLWEWGLASLGDPVELIVSELATNALRASAGGQPSGRGYPPEGRPQPIGLRLGSDQHQVLVEVWDGSPAPPVAGLVSGDGETGRGLLMVQAMSRAMGLLLPGRGRVEPHGGQGRLGSGRSRGRRLTGGGARWVSRRPGPGRCCRGGSVPETAARPRWPPRR